MPSAVQFAEQVITRRLLLSQMSMAAGAIRAMPGDLERLPGRLANRARRGPLAVAAELLGRMRNCPWSVSWGSGSRSWRRRG